MKYEIEIDDDLSPYDEQPSLCVYATRVNPYHDRDNYLCEKKDDPVLLCADTLEELYERMGETVVSHLLYGEQAYSSRHIPPEEWKVEFSDIFVRTHHYSEDKMRESKAFQGVGLARENARKKEAERQRVEAERAAKWNAEQKEKRDAEEYQRLRRKFETPK